MPDTDPASSFSCPGCGRDYPSERYAPGRTFRCACGARAGRRLRRDLPMGDHARPRFLADVVLGRLARWLRVLGYDCAWEPEIEDAVLVRRGIEEHRVILTRDRRLAADWWVDGIVLLQHDHPLEQLRELTAVVELSDRWLFTRCTRCDRPLEPALPAEVEARVPADVRARQTEFSACPACRRIYWQGGHVERMRRTLREVLED